MMTNPKLSDERRELFRTFAESFEREARNLETAAAEYERQEQFVEMCWAISKARGAMAEAEALRGFAEGHFGQ